MTRHFVVRVLVTVLTFLSPLLSFSAVHAQDVQLKALGRFEGWRDNPLIGYGLVVGLAGSGDTRRNDVTRQSLQNVLSRLGVTVTEDQISSRNVAVVLVIATLPASANVGDRISVTVSSSGDARSLAGGILLLTPLLGPDKRTYALAQGPLLTGGYSFESESNLYQRNFPTTARLEMGATVEKSVNANVLQPNGELGFLLTEPNFTTSKRIAQAINKYFGYGVAWAKDADEVRIAYAEAPGTRGEGSKGQNTGGLGQLVAFISKIEALKVTPDRIPRIVINERTGTVVAGGDVMISSVVVSQGDIKVTVTAENYASQPSFIAGFASDVSSLIVANTELEVEQGTQDVVASFPSTNVADLVQGLSKAGVDTRRMISILQAIKAAGALHCEIIVQ